MTPVEKRAYDNAYYAKNRTAVLERRKARRLKNPRPSRDSVKEYYAKNRPACLARSKARYANSEKTKAAKAARLTRPRKCEDKKTRVRNFTSEAKEKMKASGAAYRKTHKHQANAHTAARHAAKLRATPGWACRVTMREFYAEAEYQQLDVDHIVPLRGPGVCGLHWEGNMQLLTPTENKRKGNRYLSE